VLRVARVWCLSTVQRHLDSTYRLEPVCRFDGLSAEAVDILHTKNSVFLHERQCQTITETTDPLMPGYVQPASGEADVTRVVEVIPANFSEGHLDPRVSHDSDGKVFMEVGGSGELLPDDDLLALLACPVTGSKIANVTRAASAKVTNGCPFRCS
jgi:hypothetical protein